MELSVVILTKNEERNLPGCLDSIPSKYRILIVDSGSTDNTLQIARARGSRVVENDWEGFAAQRNFALQKCGIESKWILFIDADERYPFEFFDWFEREVANDDSLDAVMVPSVLVFNGKELRYAPGYPIYHPRLVRTTRVKFVNNHAGHGETIPNNLNITNATIGYHHYFYNGDLISWMVKHIGNASKEYNSNIQEELYQPYRARMSARVGKTILRIPLRFIYHYVVKQGFRDGRAGLEYSLIYAWYEVTKYIMWRCTINK